MTLWEQFALFALKFGFIFIFIIILIIMIGVLVSKNQQDKTVLKIKNLSEGLEEQKDYIEDHFNYSKEELKKIKKQQKEEDKLEKNKKSLPKVFVLDFDGDVKASQVDLLSKEVTAVISVAKPEDQVVVRLESPGGVVHGYGLAAAQLMRFKQHNLRLTVCVDKVAASGGYMMACTAEKIIAAPFAILGSIGVVAQVPNFHKILKKHDVEYKEYTAGDYKRTVSLFGEITPKGEEKFKEQLEDTHVLFKDFVSEMRPKLDVTKVATGEYWFGKTALKLGLVDALQTSNEFLLDLSKQFDLIHMKMEEKKSLQDKLGGILGQVYEKSLEKILDLSARSKLH